MSGRTPAEAVRLHQQQVQRLVALVTNSVVRTEGDRQATERRIITFPSQTADLFGVRLKLLVRQHFRTFDLAGRHTLIVVGYQYSMLDAAEHEILSYHWHPSSRSPLTEPHLHLGSAAQVRQRDLVSAHLPTGIINLTEIVELLIGRFGVVPRVQNWREVVAEARASR